MDNHTQAFDAFLFRLEPDLPDAGERYKQLRRKMIKFFAWKCCEDPDGLADETITRMARNLSAGEDIRTDKPYAYVYAIAKNIYREYIRDRKKREAITNGLSELPQQKAEDSEDCRKECFQKLSGDNIRLLQKYYTGDDDRDHLAETLNISLNSLRLKIHRLKQGLRVCEEQCLGGLKRG